MNLQTFITKRPFLYHLTSVENAVSIIQSRKILSTNAIIDASGNPEYDTLKRNKRTDHKTVLVDGKPILIRDQQPIIKKLLNKCLTHKMTMEDFLEHLNARVFMWATVPRLVKHYTRYKRENPTILRFKTDELLELNPHVKFCRLNSGATRANTSWGGIPPPRGPDTFLSADKYILNVGTVAEVTFEKECNLTGCEITQSLAPDGAFTVVVPSAYRLK